MIEWLTTNWEGCVAIFAAVLALANTVVKLTPTKTDDEFVAKVTEVFESLTKK